MSLLIQPIWGFTLCFPVCCCILPGCYLDILTQIFQHCCHCCHWHHPAGIMSPLCNRGLFFSPHFLTTLSIYHLSLITMGTKFVLKANHETLDVAEPTKCQGCKFNQNPSITLIMFNSEIGHLRQIHPHTYPVNSSDRPLNTLDGNLDIFWSFASSSNHWQSLATSCWHPNIPA
jgi:hypothetical protein